MVGVDSNEAYTFLAYHAGNDALPGDEWQMAWVLDGYFYPGCQAASQVNTTGQACPLCRDPASALPQWLLAPRFVTTVRRQLQIKMFCLLLIPVSFN